MIRNNPPPHPNLKNLSYFLVQHTFADRTWLSQHRERSDVELHTDAQTLTMI